MIRTTPLIRSVARRGASSSSSSLSASSSAAAGQSIRSASSSTTSSSAQQTASSAASTIQKQASNILAQLRKVGGPLFSKLEASLGQYSQPIVYNAKVGLAIARQVYVAEGMAPPRSIKTIVDSYKTLYETGSQTGYAKKVWNNGEWKKIAIYAVEAYGIFTIGEMIGRRSLVGYKLKKHDDGHGHH